MKSNENSWNLYGRVIMVSLMVNFSPERMIATSIVWPDSVEPRTLLTRMMFGVGVPSTAEQCLFCNSLIEAV